MEQLTVLGQAWLLRGLMSGLDWYFTHATTGVWDWLITWLVRIGVVLLLASVLLWLVEQARVLAGILVAAVFACVWALTHSVASASWTWQADRSLFAVTVVALIVCLSLLSRRALLVSLALVLAYVPFHYHAIASGHIDNGRVLFVPNAQLPRDGLGSALGGLVLSMYGSGDLPQAQITAMYGPNAQLLTNPLEFYAAPLERRGWPPFFARLAARYMASRDDVDREGTTQGVPLIMPRSLGLVNGDNLTFGDALIVLYPYLSLAALLLCGVALVAMVRLWTEPHSSSVKTAASEAHAATLAEPAPNGAVPSVETSALPKAPVVSEDHNDKESQA